MLLWIRCRGGGIGGGWLGQAEGHVGLQEGLVAVEVGVAAWRQWWRRLGWWRVVSIGEAAQLDACKRRLTGRVTEDGASRGGVATCRRSCCTGLRRRILALRAHRGSLVGRRPCPSV